MLDIRSVNPFQNYLYSKMVPTHLYLIICYLYQTFAYFTVHQPVLSTHGIRLYNLKTSQDISNSLANVIQT